MLNLLIDQVVILFLLVMFVIIFNLNKLSIFLLVFVGIYLLYYFLMELIFSQTIGKILTKSKVVTIEGNRPSSLQVSLRTICRFIPFEQYSFIDSNIGLHDKLSKTIVVYKNNNP